MQSIESDVAPNSGHAQQKHETAHGSMQHTVWATEGPEESPFEVGGHRFGAQDRGAPQLCSMNCKHLGRHAHLEFCRNPLGICQEADTEHVHERIQPEPDAPKDWVSHKLFWTRTGRHVQETPPTIPDKHFTTT